MYFSQFCRYNFTNKIKIKMNGDVKNIIKPQFTNEHALKNNTDTESRNLLKESIRNDILPNYFFQPEFFKSSCFF